MRCKRLLVVITLASSNLGRSIALPPTVASLLSGSIAGAIGIGVAFPLDTLTTRAQVKSQEQSKRGPECTGVAPTSSTRATRWKTRSNAPGARPQITYDLSTAQVVRTILRTEGVGAFFNGVRTMMFGQAMIKAVAFSANHFALSVIKKHMSVEASSSMFSLLAAACFAGFASSFLVAPVERIKVMMQVGGGGSSCVYKNEVECARHVIVNEGWGGLFARGLGPTLAREVPACAIYFAVYGLLIQSPIAGALGKLGPAVCGAVCGCACWIPVYPIDLLKTLVQNSSGDKVRAWDISKALYRERGIGAFFDGIDTKMARAATNHSITFWLYDWTMRFLQK